MLAAIVGGRLQGVELACLAHHAGWRTLLVDRKNHVPARRLCDRFLQLDVRQASALDDALKAVDLVIPALEDQAALDGLVGMVPGPAGSACLRPKGLCPFQFQNRLGPVVCIPGHPRPRAMAAVRVSGGGQTQPCQRQRRGGDPETPKRCRSRFPAGVSGDGWVLPAVSRKGRPFPWK